MFVHVCPRIFPWNCKHHATEESAQADRDIAIMKYMAKHKTQAGVPANVWVSQAQESHNM